MTDPHPPDPDQFELISAYVDGEATDEERARVEDDATLLARADQLSTLRTRLAAPAPPHSLVDTHVAAALDAFDGVDRTMPETSTSTVRQLGAHRNRRLLQRFPLLAAAAVLIVVALAGALVARGLGGDTRSDETASGATTTTVLSDAAGSTFESSAQDDANLAPAPATVRPEFGTVDDFAAFVADRAVTRTSTAEGGAAADSAAPSTTIAPAGPPTDPCDAVSVAGVDPAAVDAVVPAIVAGRAVTGVVERTPGEHRRLVVVDDATCVVVDERTL